MKMISYKSLELKNNVVQGCDKQPSSCLEISFKFIDM